MGANREEARRTGDTGMLKADLIEGSLDGWHYDDRGDGPNDSDLNELRIGYEAEGLDPSEAERDLRRGLRDSYIQYRLSHGDSLIRVYEHPKLVLDLPFEWLAAPPWQWGVDASPLDWADCYPVVDVATYRIVGVVMAEKGHEILAGTGGGAWDEVKQAFLLGE